MKSVLLLVMALFYSLVSQAQTVTVLKGEKADYVKTDDGMLGIVKNIKNRDTTDLMYNDNGERAHWELFLEKLPTLAAKRVFCDFLTPEELTVMKKLKLGFLRINVMADKNGYPIEVYFRYNTLSDSVLNGFSADRWYALEQKLRPVLNIFVAERFKSIRNIKYSVLIAYREL